MRAASTEAARDPAPEITTPPHNGTVAGDDAASRWRTFRADRGGAPPMPVLPVAAREPEAPVREDIHAGEGFSWQEALGFAADVAGIVDPTPISDAIGGVQSLAKGDLVGAGLSAASMVPYVGDGLAKPAKLLKRITEAFPALAKLAQRSDDLLNTLSKLKSADPTVLNNTLKALNNIAEKAAERYAAHPAFLDKAKKLGLPTDGPIAFVPPKNWNVGNPQRTSDKKGFIDAFGNEWRKGPSRTPGEAFEWDVIPAGDSALKNLSRDGSHLNVSLTGAVTHR